MKKARANYASKRRVRGNGAQQKRLRRRAEKLLKKKPSLAPRRTARNGRTSTTKQRVDRLVHELSVHQIELEMQNEELRRAQTEAELSHLRFLNLYETVPVGCLTLDRRGTILDVNQAAVDMLGASRNSLIGRRLHILIDEKDRSQFTACCNALFRGKRVKPYEFRLAEGVEMPKTVLAFGSRVKHDNSVTPTLHLAMTDISQLKQADAALHEKDQFTRALLENSATVAWMKDSEGRYVYLSQTFEQRFGIRFEDWQGKTDLEVWPKELAEKLRDNDLRVLKNNCVLEDVEEAQNPDGSRSWWLSHKFPFVDASGNRHVGGLAVEITDRIRVEDELRMSQAALSRHQAKLQELTSKLLTAQEDERQRISRELHDDFSQRLAALVIDVSSLEQRPPLLPELIATALKPVREQLEQLADDVHTLAYTLHPSLLAHAGLQPAIEDHILQVSHRTGLRITLDVGNLSGWCSLDQATCLFRVLQESLQNIVKHANATDVMVRLSGSPKGVGLSVIDNGRGFDVQGKSADQMGLGVVSMQERLRLLNGFLHIYSCPSEGTRVCAWVPAATGES